MPALTEIFGDDSVLQFGGGTLGHPWGNAPGAVANRVALEACVQARNEGRDLAAEGNTIIREACKWSPELAAACEVWKEIKFEFKPVDTLDNYMNNDSTSEDSLYNRSMYNTQSSWNNHINSFALTAIFILKSCALRGGRACKKEV
ncbi:hypothetical protein ACJIZ3_000335 [Penstemon smallii]|uniref:Ribulose bisphosphate carboxylase large subunit C-terminal domain-containing protein n=1 Tax=Penstemon smallii TaxID=265156 RepID=A0ABD3R5S3_9LAMI